LHNLEDGGEYMRDEAAEILASEWGLSNLELVN
jgi:hypothetical protein